MKRQPSHKPPPDAGKVRIIGGQWRGRRLTVPPIAAVRPSADRVRETLFNWLSARLPGARCLDLFAGTGVLGFEALSRGARNVTLLDNDLGVIQHLTTTRQLLTADHAEILRYDALTWLRQHEPVAYDVVFVDPPFAADLGEQTLAELSRGWVTATGVVYLEAPVAPSPSPQWTCLRQGHTRQVVYTLLAPAGASANPNGEP